MKVNIILILFLVASSLVDAQESSKSFVSIFDGKTLNGWDGDPIYWKVEDGCIVGTITHDNVIKRNTFLIWTNGRTKDFELKLEYLITTDGNSGINYRSERLTDHPYSLKGYQSDIDGKNKYTGQNYEERGRTTLAYHGQKTKILRSKSGENLRDMVKNNAWTNLKVEKTWDNDSLNNFIKSNDWNEVHLIVKGNHMQHFVNGLLMSEVIDDDKVNRKMDGYLGVQVHVGPPMRVKYRNIKIKQL